MANMRKLGATALGAVALLCGCNGPIQRAPYEGFDPSTRAASTTDASAPSVSPDAPAPDAATRGVDAAAAVVWHTHDAGGGQARLLGADGCFPGMHEPRPNAPCCVPDVLPPGACDCAAQRRGDQTLCVRDCYRDERGQAIAIAWCVDGGAP